MLVHVATSLDVCMKRDVKGLYRKALDGTISEFTGECNERRVCARVVYPNSKRFVLQATRTRMRSLSTQS